MEKAEESAGGGGFAFLLLLCRPLLAPPASVEQGRRQTSSRIGRPRSRTNLAPRHHPAVRVVTRTYPWRLEAFGSVASQKIHCSCAELEKASCVFFILLILISETFGSRESTCG